ncbi:unnamed protein product [Fusarium fujikuroi]|nr:unnamed protein product [Fusarium fujikuroi]
MFLLIKSLESDLVCTSLAQALYQILPAGGWIGWNVGLGSWRPLCCPAERNLCSHSRHDESVK